MKFPFRRLVQIAQAAEELRDLLPEVAKAVLDAVTAGVGAIQELLTALVSARARVRETIQLRKSVRSALRQDLEAIRRTARAVAIGQPDIDAGKFDFPPHGDAKLLTSARAIADNVRPLRETFVGYAMPRDFPEILSERIRVFEHALGACASATRMVVHLKARLEAAIEDTSAKASRLDPVVRNALAGDDVAIAAWDKACRLPRRRVRKDRSVAGAQPEGLVPTQQPDEGLKASEPVPEIEAAEAREASTSSADRTEAVVEATS